MYGLGALIPVVPSHCGGGKNYETGPGEKLTLKVLEKESAIFLP